MRPRQIATLFVYNSERQMYIQWVWRGIINVHLPSTDL